MKHATITKEDTIQRERSYVCTCIEISEIKTYKKKKNLRYSYSKTTLNSTINNKSIFFRTYVLYQKKSSQQSLIII